MVLGRRKRMLVLAGISWLEMLWAVSAEEWMD